MRAFAAWLLVLGLLAGDLGLASDLFRVYAQGARSLSLPAVTGGPPAAPADDIVPAAPTPFELPPLESFAAAIERPLFSPGRRPPVPGAAPVEEPPAVSLEIDLVGVVITGSQGIAVLLPRERGAEAVRLNLGQDYSGWVLSAIEPLSATFERDGEIRTLDLLFDRPQAVDPRARRLRRRQ